MTIIDIGLKSAGNSCYLRDKSFIICSVRILLKPFNILFRRPWTFSLKKIVSKNVSTMVLNEEQTF